MTPADIVAERAQSVVDEADAYFDALDYIFYNAFSPVRPRVHMPVARIVPGEGVELDSGTLSPLLKRLEALKA